MELSFETTLKKFDSKGEKTGWTYIEIPFVVSDALSPNNKKSFRVKGRIDEHDIKGVALIPMGNAQFIMAVNANMRKVIRKNVGASVVVNLSLDTTERKINTLLLDCLADDPTALRNFKKLSPSHQMYYSKWIEEAKTEPTQIKRITQTVQALSLNKEFGAMLRDEKANKLN